MNTRRLSMCITLSLIMVFMLAACFFFSSKAYAASADSIEQEEIIDESAEPAEGDAAQDDENAPSNAQNGAGEETDATDDNKGESISQSVQDYLKSIYGADYEKYYNQIVENWGSVEAYLLNASENLPEEYKYKATELLTTINAYIGVAADAVLLLCGGIYLIYRAKKNKQLNTDLRTLKMLSNQTEVGELAIIKCLQAQNNALRALMPGEKFADSTAALAESDKELNSATEEVKRNV